PGPDVRPARRPGRRAQRPAARADDPCRPAPGRRLVAARVVSVHGRVRAGNAFGAAVRGHARSHLARHAAPVAGAGPRLRRPRRGVQRPERSRAEWRRDLDVVHVPQRVAAAANLQRRGRGGPGARRVDDRARTAHGDGLQSGGARSVDRLRGGHRARRARQREVDRAAAVLAAHRRRRHVELHLAVTRAAVASAALALATFALFASPARAADAADGGAPDAPADAQRADAGSPDGGAAAADARAVFEPPRALSPAQVPYPADAPQINEPVSVTVKLMIDTTGAVTKVELVTPPAPPWDEAVIAAARDFRFDPGRYGGKPVPVTITFTQKFLPRARPPAPTTPGAPDTAKPPPGPPLTASLRGRLVELGTRRPLANAAVVAVVDGQPYRTESDAGGHFRLPLPAGAARVSVFGPEHNAFVQQEKIAAGQELVVKYMIERERYNLNETVVIAERRRDEVSRVSLRGDEIQKVPGTFGD